MLPVPDLAIELSVAEDDARRATLTAHTPCGEALLA